MFLVPGSHSFYINSEPKHRGYGFVTFGTPADAQDAIDNMDMNELKGRVLKVNLARPMKGPIQPMGNRAGVFIVIFTLYPLSLAIVWESEEWLKENVKPLSQNRGTGFA
jgi:peptidyl-prolyl isomerase E (cyclophilin E)